MASGPGIGIKWRIESLDHVKNIIYIFYLVAGEFKWTGTKDVAYGQGIGIKWRIESLDHVKKLIYILFI